MFELDWSQLLTPEAWERNVAPWVLEKVGVILRLLLILAAAATASRILGGLLGTAVQRFISQEGDELAALNADRRADAVIVSVGEDATAQQLVDVMGTVNALGTLPLQIVR